MRYEKGEFFVGKKLIITEKPSVAQDFARVFGVSGRKNGYIENNEFTDEDMVDIAHTYSKDIEHLEENIEALAELFETNDVFDIEEMVMALMN